MFMRHSTVKDKQVRDCRLSKRSCFFCVAITLATVWLWSLSRWNESLDLDEGELFKPLVDETVYIAVIGGPSAEQGESLRQAVDSENMVVEIFALEADEKVVASYPPNTQVVRTQALEQQVYQRFLEERNEAFLVIVTPEIKFDPAWIRRMLWVLPLLGNDAVLFLGEYDLHQVVRCNTKVCELHSRMESLLDTAIQRNQAVNPSRFFALSNPVLARSAALSAQFPKILVVSLTKNRKEYVLEQATSMRASNLPTGKVDVVVFDDGSTEYTDQDLRTWYPNVKEVVKIAPNAFQGTPASERGNFLSRQVLEFFLKSGRQYDRCIVLDSDIVLHPFWYQRLSKLIEDFPGSLFSLYNSCSHPSLNCWKKGCEKDALGNSGTVWSRELAEMVLKSNVPTESFDWSYSEFLKKVAMRKLVAASPSLVEHVGVSGSHGTGSRNEMSVDFQLEDLSPALRRYVYDNLVMRRGCGRICRMSQINPLDFRTAYRDNFDLYCRIVDHVLRPIFRF